MLLPASRRGLSLAIALMNLTPNRWRTTVCRGSRNYYKPIAPSLRPDRRVPRCFGCLPGNGFCPSGRGPVFDGRSAGQRSPQCHRWDRLRRHFFSAADSPSIRNQSASVGRRSWTGANHCHCRRLRQSEFAKRPKHLRFLLRTSQHHRKRHRIGGQQY